jgi:hypothetical protein
MTRTSDYLKRCLQNPTGEHIPETVAFNTTIADYFVRLIGNMVIGKFALIHHMSGSISAPKEKLAELVDDALCRAMLERVPATASRLMRFEQIQTLEPFDENVAVYFAETMQCYALGMPVAAIGLARASLEQALRDTLPQSLIGNEPGLEPLLRAAALSRKLDAVQLAMASEIQRTGNQVLHRQPCNDEQVFKVVLSLRTLIHALYGREDVV